MQGHIQRQTGGLLPRDPAPTFLVVTETYELKILYILAAVFRISKMEVITKPFGK